MSSATGQLAAAASGQSVVDVQKVKTENVATSLADRILTLCKEFPEVSDILKIILLLKHIF